MLLTHGESPDVRFTQARHGLVSSVMLLTHGESPVGPPSWGVGSGRVSSVMLLTHGESPTRPVDTQLVRYGLWFGYERNTHNPHRSDP
jgi:hypothetical protein